MDAGLCGVAFLLVFTFPSLTSAELYIPSIFSNSGTTRPQKNPPAGGNDALLRQLPRPLFTSQPRQSKIGFQSNQGVQVPRVTGHRSPEPYPPSVITPSSLREEEEVTADGEFYEAYHKSVLQSRKPFALDKGFIDPVIKVYRNKKRWLDAGAGTCGTMEHLIKKGFQVSGVELSPSNNTACNQFLKQNRLKAAPLHQIPFANKTFDLVWSSEVMPRMWWDAAFLVHGCRVNRAVREQFAGKYAKTTFFPYVCDSHPWSTPTDPGCLPAVNAMARCMTHNGGNLEPCEAQQQTVENICDVV
mmetsp:Transcript_44253/g.73702  ORF Transcript_44253/g.73702 Transcript_44253/m.73702 type:complete len:301 (+) Transcript_44253:146-1048(+)